MFPLGGKTESKHFLFHARFLNSLSCQRNPRQTDKYINSHPMSDDWRNEPATERQKEKLHFFGCTWDEGITAGQASDALEECAKQFPDVEAAYLKSELSKPTEQLNESLASEVVIQNVGTSATQASARREGFFSGESSPEKVDGNPVFIRPTP